MNKDEQIKRLKRGNTALIEALMDMCLAHCSDANHLRQTGEQNPMVSHDFLSDNERALALLEEAGFAETLNQVEYWLLYDKIQERIKAESEEK